MLNQACVSAPKSRLRWFLWLSFLLGSSLGCNPPPSHIHPSLRSPGKKMCVGLVDGIPDHCIPAPPHLRIYDPSREIFRTAKTGEKLPTSCLGVIRDIFVHLHPYDKDFLRSNDFSRKKGDYPFYRIYLGKSIQIYYSNSEKDVLLCDSFFEEGEDFSDWILEQLKGLAEAEKKGTLKLTFLKKRRMFRPLFCEAWAKKLEEGSFKDEKKKIEKMKLFDFYDSFIQIKDFVFSKRGNKLVFLLKNEEIDHFIRICNFWGNCSHVPSVIFYVYRNQKDRGK